MKQVPSLLLVGLALALGFELVQLVHALFASNADAIDAGWLLAQNGVNIAAWLLAALGLADLRRRLSGRAARGARTAAIALAAQAVAELGWIGVGYLAMTDLQHFPRDAWRAVHLATTATSLVAAIGIGVAARRWIVGVACAALATLANPPWFVAHALWGGHAWSFHAQALIQFGPRAVLDAMLIVAAILASRGTVEVTAGGSIAPGLRGASRAVWLRVGAAVLFAVNLALTGQNGFSIAHGVALFASILEGIALAWLAWGLVIAVRGSVAELPRWPLVSALALALWLVGVAIAQLPWRYAYMTEHVTMISLQAPSAAVYYAAALSTARLVFAAAAIVCVLGALRQLAARRGLETLRARIGQASIGFIVLTAVGVAIQRWLGYSDTLLGLAILACGAGAVIVALALAARAIAAAAAAIDQQPGLPAAKVV